MELDNRAPEKELDTYGVYASNTKGVSMEPLFRTNRDMVIIRKPTEELKKEIQNYVKKNTAPYKYPRIVVFRDELPKTTSGKIIRAKL